MSHHSQVSLFFQCLWRYNSALLPPAPSCWVQLTLRVMSR